MVKNPKFGSGLWQVPPGRVGGKTRTHGSGLCRPAMLWCYLHVVRHAMPCFPSVMFLKHMFIGMSRVSSFPPPAPAAALPDGDVLIGVTGDGDDHGDDHGDDGTAASGGEVSEVSPISTWSPPSDMDSNFRSLVELLSGSLL